AKTGTGIVGPDAQGIEKIHVDCYLIALVIGPGWPFCETEHGIIALALRACTPGSRQMGVNQGRRELGVGYPVIECGTQEQETGS
ncbi:MAG TPA: hypothetical protein VJN01_09790, partial [Xanthomonadales bacterium]|nr:hypothetical protein [Xanthomonadales bacterium]